MSLRPGLLPSLLRAAHPARAATRSFHFLPRGEAAPTASRLAQRLAPRAAPRVASRSAPRPRMQNAYMYSLGLGVAGLALWPRAAKCASPQPHPGVAKPSTMDTTVVVTEEPEQPPVKSIVSLRELSFGAVCGICAGVFLKKGFRIVAFALGGVFVLLQYLSSKKFVKVDWKKIGSSYDSQFAVVDEKTGKVTVGVGMRRVVADVFTVPDRVGLVQLARGFPYVGLPATRYLPCWYAPRYPHWIGVERVGKKGKIVSERDVAKSGRKECGGCGMAAPH